MLAIEHKFTSHLTDGYASTTHSNHRINYWVGHARPLLLLFACEKRSLVLPSDLPFFPWAGPSAEWRTNTQIANRRLITTAIRPKRVSRSVVSPSPPPQPVAARVTLPHLALMMTARARCQPSVPSDERKHSILLHEVPRPVSR